MSTFKTVMLMVGLVVIGFLGGFFMHHFLTQKKIEEIKSTMQAGGFSRMLLRHIDLSEKQSDVIKPILNEYGSELADFHFNMIEQRKQVLDSMWSEIKPHLNPDQLEELSERIKRFRQGPPPPRRRHGGKGRFREGKKMKRFQKDTLFSN